MNDHLNELLSAFYDGEATPAERAEAERVLRESTDAQVQMGDFASLSQTLRALPRRTLPDEFRTAVLQNAERATLLPPAEIVKPVRRGRKWWLGSLGTAVAACAVLVVMFTQRQAPRRGVDAGPQLARQADSAAAELPEAADATPPPVDQKGAGLPDERLAMRAARGAEAGEAAGSTALTAAGPRIQTSARHLTFDTQNLTQVEIGDIVEAIDDSGDGVSVVHLTVVDREEGLSALKLILQRCRIEEDPGAEYVPPTEGLTAVFVESHRDQLAAAIEQLNSGPFGTMEIGAPMQVAQLDPESQSRLGVSARSDADAGVGFGETARTLDAEPVPAAVADAPRAAESEKVPTEAARSLAKSEPRGTLGRQRAFVLPPDALVAQNLTQAEEPSVAAGDRVSVDPPPLPESVVFAEPAQSEAAPAEPAVAQNRAAEDRAQEFAAKSEPAALSLERPVQVIFVLLDGRTRRNVVPAPAAPRENSRPVRKPGAA